MNGERINTNTTNNGWEELKNQPFVGGIDTSNWQKTASGIYLPPERKSPNRSPVRLEKPMDVVTPPEEIAPVAKEEVVIPVVKEEIAQITEEVTPVVEKEVTPVIEDREFIQSTDEANRLKKDPEYFTYLVSAERGFAVKRDGAIQFFEEGLKSAQDDKEMSKMQRMERSILDSNGVFSEEEKQQVRDFIERPEIRKKKIEYELKRSQKLLKNAEDDVRYRKEEYSKYKSMNLVAKFLNMDAKQAAEERLEWAEKTRLSLQNKISQLEDELAELSEAA